MGVIAYDRPVRDFIAGLNATGHVTHTQHRKTKIAFHHNGGRLSLGGILDVWKVRPASAHFQVDGAGAIGQYVLPNEYAWALGNTQGNKECISIELANATLAPSWLVSEVTMMEGARLAGWLFAKLIGERPTDANIEVHHNYKQTLCAGPCIDRNLGRMIEQAQVSYLHFTGYTPPPPAAPGRPSVDDIAREVIAGHWGNNPQRGERLLARGYSPSEVQAAVNRILGKAPTGAQPLSVTAIARQVIANQWGSGPERKRRLTAAGYNADLVQAEVNRLMGR
jgi:hypothetical protein